MAQSFHFPRGGLAAAIADRITGVDPFGAQPTICLGAPRRTGKSTFLRRDLAPAAEGGVRIESVQNRTLSGHEQLRTPAKGAKAAALVSFV